VKTHISFKWGVTTLHIKTAVILVLALLSSACGTVGLPGLPGNTITSRYSDPTGDASAPGGTAYDVTQVITNRIDNPSGGAYDTLQVVITFNQTVVLPPPGSTPDFGGTQLGNIIHIDADRNAATGFGSSICGLDGIEFVVDGNTTRLANGNYQVFTGPGLFTVSGEATPSVAGNVLTVNIPLSALGGDDGETNLVELAAQRFGGAFDNFTDCAPGDPTAQTGGAVVTRQPAGSKGLKSR
jgi:hypothetical protein